MTEELYAELEKTFFRYKAALRADVPNLLEVRAYSDQLLNRWHVFMKHQQYGIVVKPRTPVRLRVISNEHAVETEDRGPSSPLKNSEIQELENLAKRLFGESVECSTVWH